MATASAPAREMRERKAGPPLLSAGPPEPQGKAKAPRRPTKKKAGASKKASGKSKVGGVVAAGNTRGTGSPDGQNMGGSGGDTKMDPVLPEPGQAEADGDGDDERIFCVCLGKDDGRPMIECEGCENWYHFGCIELDDDKAKHISTYFCELCEQAGSGKTQWHMETLAPSDIDPVLLPPMPMPLTPSDSGGEYEDRANPDAKKASRESDGDYSESGTGHSATRKRKDSQTRKSSISSPKKKRRVVEDDDDKAEIEKEKESAKKQNKALASGSIMYSHSEPSKKGSTSDLNSTSATENKTRKHCTEQFEKMFSSIFTAAAATASPGKNVIKIEKAGETAESVEANLFTNFSELDSSSTKGGRLPKQKYLAKFRTLHFNLKSNDYFRSRIASGELDARAIVAMSQEDLLTPEARAEQEAMKERSLAQSVKVATAVPKTRMTHKGEEVIDEFDPAMLKGQKDRARDLQSTENAAEELERSIGGIETGGDEGMSSFSAPILPRDRSRSMSTVAGAMSPKLDTSPYFHSASAMSPVIAGSPVQAAFSPVETRLSGHDRRDSNTFVAPTPPERFIPTLNSAETSPTAADARPALSHSRSDSISRARLDLDRVWGAYKSPIGGSSVSPAKEEERKAISIDKAIDGPDGLVSENNDPKTDNLEKLVSDLEEDNHTAADYDPFAVLDKSTADEDFDAIMNLSGDVVQAEPPPVPAEEVEVPDAMAGLSSVWQGAVIHPEEGGFPARIVQVGGTPLGIHPNVWDTLLPKGTINISGRIDVKAASEYLVQSRFANTREIVVLAHLPDGETDPSAAATTSSKPSMEKALARHAHLVAFLSDKKRFGVCPPEDELKRRIKDHYIVPLKKDEPLPDFIELLDEHVIAETEKRKRDLLLSVLVLQKGTGAGAPTKPSGAVTPLPHSNSPRRDQSISMQTFQQPDPAPAISQFPPPLDSSHLKPASTFPQSQFAHSQQPDLQQANHSSLPVLDPAALQSLLSNPALLQALQNGPSPALPPHLQQQGNIANLPTLHNPPPNPQLINPSFPMHMRPQNSPSWHPQQHLAPQLGPNSQHWHPAGSPLWPGGQQNHPQGWRSTVPPVPQPTPPMGGYVHPDRQFSSATIRGDRSNNREDRTRRDDRSDRYRSAEREDHRYSDERDGSRYTSDRSRGFQRERGESREDTRERERGRSSGGKDINVRGRRNSRDRSDSSNQMNSGIQDRGWGRRSGG